MTSKNKPQRHAAHRKEDKSKREFEDLIDPFFIPGWNTRDYGIDSTIEITSDSDEWGNAELESKCFLIQLKSTAKLTLSKNEISFPLPVKKIFYWYNYNLPVLFVLYDLASNKFYYLWIGELLLSELESQNHDWSNQKTVTVKIPVDNILDKESKFNLVDYVVKWKAPPRRKLEPGKYFQLKTQGISFLKEYKSIAQQFNFSSINETIKNIERDIELSLYRVAITGPSRVGKSSLINGLLKKKVSPIGLFQTTGVPIQVIPGIEDKVTVYFNNSADLQLPFSLEKIKLYASQDFNEDNKKDVRLISISVRNQQLESGVSLFDIPGLDDPSDEILSYTWQTIRKVNAVIYVIDASPMQDGGYIFRNDYKKHITKFSQSQDRIFLVFNKADKLSADNLLKLKGRVNADLIKHGLDGVVGDKVFYISAEQNKTCSGADNVDHLNEKLWEFILGENKSGIVKLSLTNQELFKSTKSLAGILKTRLLDNDARNLLDSSIQSVKKKIPDLVKDLTTRQNAAREMLTISLDNKNHAILVALEEKLKKTDINAELPNSTMIKKELIENLNTSIEQANQEYLVQINHLKNYIDQWLEDNLKQLRGILTEQAATKTVDFTEIETFESPQIDFSSAWGMGFIGMATAYIFAPAYIFVIGAISFIGSIFVSAESRRAKQIIKIMEAARAKCQGQFLKIKSSYNEWFDEHIEFLNQYLSQKVYYYFEDLEEQLSKFDQKITPAELKIYEAAFSKIETLQNKLAEYDAELRSFHFTR